jgi:molybdopterin molybdotransferase
MLGRARLTDVSRAQSILAKHIRGITTGSETIALDDALDRICSAEIASPEDLPPADRSTMDGFAVVAADTFGASLSMPAYLDIGGEIFMGAVPDGAVQRGRCYKIPTGGILPQGADAVVMHEHTVPVDEHVIEITRPVGSGENIIKRGDDIGRGSSAVEIGQRLRPQELGLLAGLGISEVAVFKAVCVGVISTGDEIIDYREPLKPGAIRNINSIVLTSLIRRNGGRVNDYGIVSDQESVFFPTVERALKENDIVLFSGGSSVGMRDLGEQAIERIGDPGILIHGVSLKPGKPVIIGVCKRTPVFGLPGHPVSAMVCFDLFVRPTLQSISGLVSRDLMPALQARLKRSINSAAGRRDVVRVELSLSKAGFEAYPVLGKSGAISTLSQAHGYFIIDEHSQGQATDTFVNVYLYP